MTASPEEVLEAMAVGAAAEYICNWPVERAGTAFALMERPVAMSVVRAALRAAEERGWRLIPVEASEEMCQSARRAALVMKRGDMPLSDAKVEVFKRTHAAMLSAAPSLTEE